MPFCRGRGQRDGDSEHTFLSLKFLILFSHQGTYVPLSKQKEPPRLVVIEHDDGQPLTNGFVLVDGHIVEINTATDLCEMLAILMQCYYVWDLTYPIQYQLLGFLQMHLLKDTSAHFKKSTSFIKFEKHFAMMQ